jgi:4-amino-4-deoxy-L-arabinose transferase-like glycosyltransferase
MNGCYSGLTAREPGADVSIDFDALRPTRWMGVLLAFLAAYLALELSDLRVPGLYYDEMIQVVPALAVARGDLWSTVNWLPSTEISVFGRDVPLMTMPYMGALKTIIFIPIVGLAGTTPESVRAVTVAIGACSLLATFAFARRTVGLAAALLTVAFLATDLSFVVYVRTDYGPTALMMLLKTVAMWQLAVWWQEGRLRSLALGGLALGLGVYDKANFLWIVAGMAGAALLVAPRALLARASLRVCLVALGALALGVAPLVYYNATWPMPTWIALSEQAAATHASQTGFVDTFLQRLGVLEHLLDGAYLTREMTMLSPTGSVLALLVAGSPALVLLRGTRRESHRETTPALFALVASVLIVVAAALTPGGFAGHHLILAYPFPHLLAAAGIVTFIRCTRPYLTARVGIPLAAAISGLAVGQNLLTTYDYLRMLSVTGGTGNFSDAVYDAARVLDQVAVDAPVVVLDWGLHFPLLGLSQGRIHSVEVIDGATENLRPFLVDPRVRYVAHAPGATNFPGGWRAFASAAEAAGLRPVREERFASRDGQPIIDVYVLRRPAGTPWSQSLIGEQGRGAILDGTADNQVRLISLPQYPTPALVTVATSRTGYAVKVPDQASLHFALAQPDVVWEITTGAVATVTLVDRDRRVEIFRRSLSARDVVEHRAWSDVSLDLSPFTGETVLLEFAAEPPPEGNNASWVIWRGLTLQWPEQ